MSPSRGAPGAKHGRSADGAATPEIVPLAEAGERPVEEVGGKAHTLGRLLRAGLPVPEGFVLTTNALSPAPDRRGPGVRASGGDPPILAPGRSGTLRAAAARLGNPPLAVRSSAVSEDGAHASYAGQFRTELGVAGLEELRGAIRRCRAAGSAEHVRAYRTSRDAEEEPAGGPRLALLVQRMMDAEAAGVAFTADPRTGAPDAVIVEAVTGTGESLVSGEVTPERWRVSRDGPVRESGPERVLSEERAAEVASLARWAEEELGDPQDVEWAVADGELHLLQARPITTGTDVAPVPIPVEPPETGFWFRDEAHFPRPFHPLFSSLYIPRYEEAVADGFREFGVLVDGVELREIGGWPYSRIVPPGGKEGPAPPSWLLWLLCRIAPPLRTKMRRAREARDEGRAEHYVRRWWDEWRPELDRWIRRADAVDLSSLDRNELLRHYHDRVEAFERALRIHFKLFPPFFLGVTDLVFFCRDELGWEKGRAADLLAGVSGMSSEPGRALEELARVASESPAARRILEEPGGSHSVERLRRDAPELAAAFEEYQERYGLRVLHYDFGTPTFRERPGMVLGFVRSQLRKAEDGSEAAARVRGRREERIADARRLLDGRPEARRRFDSLLERAHRAYPVREDNEFFALSVLGLLRYAALEVGRRMAAAGHLEGPEQVLFLDDDEVRAWLDEPRGLISVARRREGRHRWAVANPGPPSYGEDPGPPPDPSPLPPVGRRVTRALLWTVENDIQTPPPDSEELEGVGASPGSYTGPARIVRSEEEFGKVRTGDVLVCPITSPTWSVLFPSIGALVTDAGGLLSHPAIIAREFGIPSVLATGRATEELSDGEMVTVDGTAGRVTPC